MRRTLLAICILALLPLMAHAYTLVLKDGRRIEVRNQYRVVNDIAIFSLPDGTRFSTSLQKINIAATEMANGEESGTFVKNVTDPPKVSKKGADASSDQESPIAANSRPSAHRLTNSDFDRYRIRREEMSREAARRAAAKASERAGTEETVAAATEPAAGKTAAQTEEEKESELLAKRRELEKSKEEYWRGRARALLTQMRVEEEQIAALQTQIQENQLNPANQSSSVSIYSPPPYSYPYPGIRIGGVPIWMGGGRTTGGSTVIINQNPGQQRIMTLQDRLTELQLQHQETLVRYDELLEEGRKAGALPGWLR